MTKITSKLTFNRTLPLPPDRLWHLLTDPQMRELWGAPDENTVLRMEIADLREGGAERHRCGPETAPEFMIDTRWYRLDAPSLACFTETLVMEDAPIFTSLVTYIVASSEGGSSLTVEVAVTSFTGEDAADDVKEGWEGGLAGLEKLAKREHAAA